MISTDLSIARALARIGMPVWATKLSEEGGPVRRGWQRLKASGSREEIASWKPGMGLCASAGVVMDVIDHDPRHDPGGNNLSRLLARLGEDSPDYFLRVRTPGGGTHYYIATLGLGRKYNPIPGFPGVDLQAEKSLVFLPPTIRKGGTYRVIEDALSSFNPEPCLALKSIIESASASAPSNSEIRSSSVSDLRDRCLRAESGEQRAALLSMVLRWQHKGYDVEDIYNLFVQLVSEMPCFDARNPWWSPSMRNPEKWFRSLLADSESFVADASPDELLGDVHIQKARSVEEKHFWDAHEILRHIHDVALVSRAAPWAVLGECLAEAICHCPPNLQLPPLVGGNGSLNMLIALTGRSGAGKDAAVAASRAAFAWHGVIEDVVLRRPLGSGEGLAKNFGYSHRGEDGVSSLVRTASSVIVTISEIDTLAAVQGRAGSTLSPQLRQLYSGQQLGFMYADVSKQVIIPEHAYRSCVIAGVQPGRGQIILGDMDGGFAQRWLWLPADDPFAPDASALPPLPMKRPWFPPEILVDDESICLFSVSEKVRYDTDMMRLKTLRGLATDMDSHSNYTRLKVAAGLALLFGHTIVGDDVWDLAQYVMKVSARCRDGVGTILEQKKVVAARDEGKLAGVRSESARHAELSSRVERNIMSKLSMLRRGEWVSFSALRKQIAARDRDGLMLVLDSMVSNGLVERETAIYQGQKGFKFRSAEGG